MPHKGTYDPPDTKDRVYRPEKDKDVVDAPDPKLLGTGLARTAGESLRKNKEEKEKILKELEGI